MAIFLKIQTFSQSINGTLGWKVCYLLGKMRLQFTHPRYIQGVLTCLPKNTGIMWYDFK